MDAGLAASSQDDRTVARTASDRRETAAAFAGLWSLVVAAAGLSWTSVGDGYPFAAGNDPGAVMNALGAIPERAAIPALTVVGALGTAVATALALRIGRGPARVAVLAFAWTLAATLLLVVPDYRVLAVVAYSLLFLVAAPLGLVTPAEYLAVFTPAVIAQFVSIAGGLAWGAAAIRYGRATSGSCQACGRSGDEGRWSAPDSARRWGRWATGVAVAIPLFYAATRWAWALGIPLGITDELLRSGQESGLWVAGAGLATVAALGAVLTLGLAMPWGERFPIWMPWIGGRDVPIPLAVVPASVVAVMVASAGIMFVRLTISGGLDEAFAGLRLLDANWAALAPELLWPAWGAALGAAAFAYALRRRGRCAACGRA